VREGTAEVDARGRINRTSFTGESGDIFPSKTFACHLRLCIKPAILTANLFSDTFNSALTAYV
jgi:hypothetical protein